MKTFTIENKTNITAHPTAREANSVADAERFATAAALARLAAHWPSARLVEIWNRLPGAVPVRKFKDRATAVSWIWKAIQSLEVPAKASAPIAPQTPRLAAEEPAAKNRAARAKKPPVPKKSFCRQSKTKIVLGLLKRPGGATLKEIMQASDWQAHSVRGFISGTIGKKMNLTIVSTRNSEGERNYCLKAEPDEASSLPPPDSIPAAFPVRSYAAIRPYTPGRVQGHPASSVCVPLTQMPDVKLLTPRPNPPDDSRMSFVTMHVGGRRYQLTYSVESREIKRGPAEMFEMPGSFPDVSAATTATNGAVPPVEKKPVCATSEPLRMMRNIGGRRFELTYRIRSSKIKRDPAEVLEMQDSSSEVSAITPNRRPQ